MSQKVGAAIRKSSLTPFLCLMCLCMLMIIMDPGRSCAESVSRCDEGLLKDEDIQSVRVLTKALKEDAFAESFGVFVRDLEQVDRSLRDVVDKRNGYLRNKCRPHNAEVDRYDEAARVWSSSHCVIGPLTKEEAPGCSSREAELKGWQARLQDAHNANVVEEGQIARELQDLNARAANPLLNAQNVLNPAYAEQALRLYTWFILKQKQRGSINSCIAFARIAEALGKRVVNQDLFIEYLTRGFVELGGVDGRLIHIIVGDPPFRPAAGSTFDATGFKKKFYGKISENQVRHAASYLAIGYKLSGGTSAVTSFSQDVARRHPEMWDYYLAVSAGQLGFRLKHGTYTTQNFADAMRGEFCE